MTNITESSVYEEGIYLLETTDPNLGGVPILVDGVPTTGHANAQAQQLANRTKWLYDNKISESSLSSLSGANLVGWERDSLTDFSSTVGQYLNVSPVSVWEFADLVISKPTPSDPNTWDWTPALSAAITSHPMITLTEGVFRVTSKITTPSNRSTAIIGPSGKYAWIQCEALDYTIEHSGADGEGITARNGLFLSNIGFQGSVSTACKGVHLLNTTHTSWCNVRFSLLGSEAFRFTEVWNSSFEDVRVNSTGMLSGEKSVVLENTDVDSCFNLKFYGLVIEGSTSVSGPRLSIEKNGTFTFAANSIHFYAPRITSSAVAIDSPDSPTVAFERAVGCLISGGQIANGVSTTQGSLHIFGGSTRNKIFGLTIASDAKYAVSVVDSPLNDIDIHVSSKTGTPTANTASWVFTQGATTVDNKFTLHRNRSNASEFAIRLASTSIVSTNDTGSNTVSSYNQIYQGGSDDRFVWQDGSVKMSMRKTSTGLLFERQTAWDGVSGTSTWQSVFEVRNDARGVKIAGGSSIFCGDDPTGVLQGTRGDMVINQFPATGERAGWIAVTTGSPADWKPFGQLGYRTSAGSPVGVLTPLFIGEEVLDTSGMHWWKSVSTTSADWKQTTN